jgi:tetrahydromethanopterin S-methyltransferase subunit D
MLLGFLMYRSGAVPKKMAILGLIGGLLAFIGGIMVLFDVLKPLSAGLFALTAIEIIWELFITFYAIFRGFRPSPFFDTRVE